MGTSRMTWAPISALRAVFTGVGRVVMVADRPEDAPDHAHATTARWRSLDLTGNVRLLSADDLDDGGAAAAEQEAPPEDEAQVSETASQDLDDNAVALPLANYDSLTLPSIRARLRSLDADQLRVLAAYERTHAERPEVLGMLERRIDRLETGR
jgi:hypothetical protein